MERGSRRAPSNSPPELGAPPAEGMFTGDGAIGALLRARDWAASPLGPVSGWSPALRGAIGMVLPACVEMVLFWGPDHIAFYNEAFAEALGDSHPHALGHPARDHWVGMWDYLGPLLDRVRGGDSIAARDHAFFIERRGARRELFFDVSYSPVCEADGSIAGVLCIVHETTDRVHTSRRVVAERERLAAMFEQAPSFMALLREPGHVYELTNRTYQYLIGNRDVLGRTVVDALPELAEQGFVDLLDEVAATGKPYTGHGVAVALQRDPGEAAEQRLLDFVYQPILDEGGHVTAIFVEGSDVTERAHAEERLALSEGSLRLATEVAGVGTWDHDLVNGVVEWSDRTRAMFGISPGVPCDTDDFYNGLHPEDRDATAAAFAAALDPAVRASYDVEYRTIGREDGQIRWIASKGRGIFDERGRCVRAIGTVIDITPRKRAQEALRESEQRFHSVADSAPALIWMCDADGRLIFVNRWHEETFGRPLGELLGQSWRPRIHPADAAGFRTDFDTAFAARAPFSRDVRVVDRDGETRWLHSEARPRQVDGRFAGYVGCDVDITDAHLASEALERGIAERTGELAATNRQLSAQIEERERVEKTLRQMQRLEAVGQLTSGVAHDFNNLLTVVLGNLDMVARAASEGGLDERTLRRIGHMRTAAERGATLTAQLLAFSRRQRLEARPIDLNATVGSMRDLLQSSLGGSVRIETRLREDLWPALVDPTQIELIILNLAINARDAMQVGGTLAVETGNVVLGEPRQPEEPAAGEYIMIAVADSGTGMTRDVLAKAFEPFFTTKEVGKGSGLGLAQVYGFAKQSGGGVAIETEPGRGTTVRVYLPRASGQHYQSQPDPPERRDVLSADAAGRRILLIDDDVPVREVTASMLRAMGAKLTEAGSGGAGLELLEATGGGFDLMVVDFAMPGMNGAEFAAIAHARWPGVPLLFVTGYADLTAIATVSEDRIVQKPFRGDELQRKVGRLIGRGGGVPD